VYFLIVLPVNKLLARMRRGEAAPDPTTKKCPELPHRCPDSGPPMRVLHVSHSRSPDALTGYIARTPAA
jgi:hypothetical protein